VNRLITSELLKLRTVRSTWAVLGGGLALSVLLALPTLALAGREDIPALGTAGSLEHVVGATLPAGLAMLLLGILAMSGEQRHATLVPTFLVAPRRGRTVAAKLVACAAVGLGGGLLALAGVLAVALPWTYAAGATPDLTGHVTALAVGAVLSAPLYALVGVGLGTLTRNTALAVVGSLAWVFLAENAILPLAAPDLARWLPAGAAAAMTGVAPAGAGLPAATAAVVFAGYGLAFAAGGWWLLARRDVG
jgi:ABC-2 type transport system permease protein